MDINQVIILLFGIAYLLFIIYTRRKSDFETFSVAGRNMGIFLIFASICASHVGPAFTMGLTRDGFKDGMFLALIGIVSGLTTISVGVFVAPKIRDRFKDSFSIGDLIGGPNGHNHPLVKIAVGLMSAWLMASITIVMSYAGGEIIHNVFGFPKFWAIAMITVVVVAYSFFGGIRASIQTDAIQFVLFVLMIPLLAFFLFWSPTFSWPAYVNHVSAVTEQRVQSNIESFAIFGILINWALLTAGLDAPFINRFLSAKNVRVTKVATILAGIFFIFWIGLMLFIGSMAAYLHPDFADNDQLLLIIAEQYYPGALYGIFIVALIGVVMSTQDSSLNMAGVAFGEDIIGGWWTDISDKQKLYLARVFTLVIGVAAIFIAGLFDSILHAIITIFSFYIPVMIPVTLFSIFKKKKHWQAAIAAMLFGLLGNVLWSWLGNQTIPNLIIGIISSCLAYWIMDAIANRIYFSNVS